MLRTPPPSSPTGATPGPARCGCWRRWRLKIWSGRPQPGPSALATCSGTGWGWAVHGCGERAGPPQPLPGPRGGPGPGPGRRARLPGPLPRGILGHLRRPDRCRPAGPLRPPPDVPSPGGHSRAFVAEPEPRTWLRAMAEHEAHHRGQLTLMASQRGRPVAPRFGLTEQELAAKSLREN